MIRSWGLVTLTGSAQPCFGDVTTAAVGLPLGNGTIPVTVASTTRYRVGDRIVLDPGQADADTLLVEVIPSATVLTCVSEGNAKTHTHVTGTIIELSIACAAILYTAVTGNAGNTWLGSDSTVTNTGGGSAFTYLSPGASYNLGFPQWNSIRSSEAWMAGPSGGSVGVAAIVV
jgi:hypothetical protein